jgi:3-keto-5-aminohexanoate cleavage enzyme
VGPVIIEAAINGVTSKERNPHVPSVPAEIAGDALACLEAGAAIIHNHIDVFSADGPTYAERQLEGWRPVLAARPDAIVYPTVAFGGTVEERFAHVPFLAESGLMRMSVFDPGSVNLGALDADGVPGGAIDFVYVNSYGDIRHEAALCEQHRLGPSISIFEPGFLRTTLAYRRAGRVPRGGFVKLYFGGDRDYLGGAGSGVGFGLPPTPAALEAYLEMLGGCDLPWAVAVIGGDVVASGLARLALARGGHIRVGLEDYGGERVPTNAELVREVVTLAAEIGRPIATCATAARLLGLPRGVE